MVQKKKRLGKLEESPAEQTDLEAAAKSPTEPIRASLTPFPH